MARDAFILRAKIDDLDLETHKICQKFPKSERHVLAAEMRRIVNDIIRLEERASRMQLMVRRARRQFRAMARMFARGLIGPDYVRPRVASFLGYAGHCDAWQTVAAMLREFVLVRRENGKCEGELIFPCRRGT